MCVYQCTVVMISRGVVCLYCMGQCVCVCVYQCTVVMISRGVVCLYCMGQCVCVYQCTVVMISRGVVCLYCMGQCVCVSVYNSDDQYGCCLHGAVSARGVELRLDSLGWARPRH